MRSIRSSLPSPSPSCTSRESCRNSPSAISVFSVVKSGLGFGGPSPVASERRPYLSILVILKIPFILSKTRPAGLPERGGPEIVPDAACYSGGAC